MREGWQRDSLCTITSVFHPGQLKGLLDMALLMLFLCTGFSNGNTFLSCLAAIPCLDFLLQTVLCWPGLVLLISHQMPCAESSLMLEGTGLLVRDMASHCNGHRHPKKGCHQKLAGGLDHYVVLKEAVRSLIFLTQVGIIFK